MGDSYIYIRDAHELKGPNNNIGTLNFYLTWAITQKRRNETQVSQENGSEGANQSWGWKGKLQYQNLRESHSKPFSYHCHLLYHPGLVWADKALGCPHITHSKPWVGITREHFKCMLKTRVSHRLLYQLKRHCEESISIGASCTYLSPATEVRAFLRLRWSLYSSSSQYNQEKEAKPQTTTIFHQYWVPFLCSFTSLKSGFMLQMLLSRQ